MQPIHEPNGTYISAALIDSRLSGIEDELRLLRGLVERLVRVEERQAQNHDDIQALRIEQATLRSKLDAAAAAGARSSWSIDRIERLGWVVVAALAAWVGQRFGG